jgi:DNA-binding MarR family transcriptional regulator
MAETPDPLGADLVLQTLSLLRRVGAATQGWQRSPVEGGFTVNQALVLHHLARHGEATPSALADWMHVTRGSVTPAIQRLEELGLVARRADPDDSRRQWLAATRKGRAAAAAAEEQVLHPVLAAFRGWDAAGLRRLCADLERVLAGPAFGGAP